MIIVLYKRYLICFVQLHLFLKMNYKAKLLDSVEIKKLSSWLGYNGAIGIQQSYWNAFERGWRAMLTISRLISSLWVMAVGGRKEGSRWCLLTEYNFYLVTSRDLSCISFSNIKKNWSLMYKIIEVCRLEILVGLKCARM